MYSDVYDWDEAWARRLGLSNVKVAHAANLLAPDKGAHLGEQQDAARLRYGLRQHYAMDDALALAFALHALQ